MARKTRSEIQAALAPMITEAIAFAAGDLSQRRAKAAQYYNGEMPDLPNVKNRSQVIMTVFRDAVLKMLPSFMRIFFGAEQPVEYTPITVAPENIAKAGAATRYIANVVIRQDNNGFREIYSWVKDALIKRTGVVKWWWEEGDIVRGDCRYMTAEQIKEIDADQNFERVKTEKTDLPGLFKVELVNRTPQGRSRFAALPPEEYIYSPGARTTDHDPGAAGVAALVGHHTGYTRSALIAMGVSEQDIDEHGTEYVDPGNAEELARRSEGDRPAGSAGAGPYEKYDYTEAYVYLDVDDDGYDELRKFCCLGGGYVVNNDGEGEYVDERPFAEMSPDPEPHVVEGKGPADWTMDMQRVITSVMRSILDSLALSLINRYAYAEGDVNPDDVDNPELGTGIRVRQGLTPSAVLQEFSHSFVGREGLGVLDALNQVVENRTGSMRSTAGLDADAMQSTTKAAVAASVSAAQERIELVARVFCETGLKRLYRGLLRLETQHAYQSRVTRIAPGVFTETDPRDFDPNMDVAVNIGIGAGLKEERAQVLLEALAKHEQMIATMGQSPMSNFKAYRDTLVKWLQVQGRMDAEQIFPDVPPDWSPTPPGQGQPDPNQVIAQAEMSKAQSKFAADQAKAQLDLLKAQQDVARQQRDLDLRQQEITLTDQRERERIEVDAAIRVREMNLKYHANITMAQIQADAARERDQAAAAAEAQRAQDETARQTATRTVRVQHDPETGKVAQVEVTHEGTAA